MGFSIACSSFCPFCQFFHYNTPGGDSLHCGISTGLMSDRGQTRYCSGVEHKISASSAKPRICALMSTALVQGRIGIALRGTQTMQLSASCRELLAQFGHLVPQPTLI